MATYVPQAGCKFRRCVSVPDDDKRLEGVPYGECLLVEGDLLVRESNWMELMCMVVEQEALGMGMTPEQAKALAVRYRAENPHFPSFTSH